MHWGIVMTADEPATLVRANVGWHLGSGASEVHVYLDRPDDPVAADLAAISGCHVTVCDAAHWRALSRKGRPEAQIRRQSLNANHALAASGADWLVHLDADEFLSVTGDLAAELHAVAPLGAELALPVWERAYLTPPGGIFDGVFRGSTKAAKGVDAALFGRDAEYLVHGLMGHAAGKCAVPVESDFVLGVHWAFRGGQGRDFRAPQWPSKAARVLHFDGLTPRHWQIKLLRYAAHDPALLERLVPEHRQRQIAEVARDAEALALHDRLRMLKPEMAARLEALGLLDQQGFAPELALDLSVEAFDAALAARYPDLWHRLNA